MISGLKDKILNLRWDRIMMHGFNGLMTGFFHLCVGGFYPIEKAPPLKLQRGVGHVWCHDVRDLI